MQLIESHRESRRTWLKQSLALAAGASWIAPASAQISSLNEAINKAGRQRMLSQRMAKSGLALGQGVELKRAEKILFDSMAWFDRQFVELKAYAPTPEIEASYKALEPVWSDYKSALVGSAPDRSAAPILLGLDAKVLKLTHQCTAQLEQYSGKATGKLVNVAGRQALVLQPPGQFSPRPNRGGGVVRPDRGDRQRRAGRRRPGAYNKTHVDSGSARAVCPNSGHSPDVHRKSYRKRAAPGGAGGAREPARIGRAAAPWRRGASGGRLPRVFDRRVGPRLVVVQTRGDGSGGSVEIVHESLIDRWPALRRWLDEDQEDAVFLSQLAAAAKQWEARQRPAGLLWRGDAGDEARRWYALRPRSLPPREQAFIDGVIHQYRRGRRARRFALGAAFVVLAGIAGAATIAYVQMSALEEKAQTALGTLVEEKRVSDENLKQRIEADKRREAADKERAAAEAQRIAAEQDQLKADQPVAAQSEAAAMSREELMKKNAELDASLRDAMAAQKSAEVAMKDAQKARGALEARMKADQATLAEKERQLREAQSKLTTKLKGLE